MKVNASKDFNQMIRFSKILSACLLLIIPLSLFCQKDSLKKYSFELSVGGHLNILLSQNYMPYDTTVIDPTRMGGYSIKSRINYHFALYYNKFICSRFHIKTGISYFNRKDYYEWNPDTVKKYYTNKPWYYTRLLNENYSSNSMDIPVFIGYKYQSLDVMLGIKFNVISFIQHKVLSLDSLKTKHTYISYFWEGGSFGNHVFYPSFIIQYTPKKLRRVSFYFSADMRRIDYFDLQIGINLKTNKLP